MATISKLKPDQIVYSVSRQKMGNTTISIGVCHEVRIVEVDPAGRFVVASWNYNPPRKFYLSQVKRWRVNKPKPKGEILGRTAY